VAITFFVSPAAEGTVIQAGGWEISVLHDGDAFVGITADYIVHDPVLGDVLLIELDKTFSSPTFEWGLVGQAIRINFMVSSESEGHVPYIAILDESIRNNTGQTWTDFHMVLIDNDNLSDPQVGFHPSYIFETNHHVPFANISFEGTNGLNGLPDRVNFLDGTVSDGEEWAPGLDGSEYNGLLIQTNLSPGQSFILKEFPMVPEPATLVLLALGGLMLIRKRKMS